MKKIILLLNILIIILVSCTDKTLYSESSGFLYNLDSSIIMYCRINNSIFYGKDIDVEGKSPWYLPNYKLIEANGIASDTTLILTNFMRTGQSYQFLSAATLNIGNDSYWLTPDKPFNLELTELADSLISGYFYGTLINYNGLDTVKIEDGMFEVHPNIENDFFLTSKLNHKKFQTNIGNEYFHRNKLSMFSIDTTYLDSLIVYFHINVGTFTDDYIREYTIWKESNNANVSVDAYSGSGDVYFSFKGISGTVTVEEVEEYEENDRTLKRISKAYFELIAESEMGEVFLIKDGHFSINGF